MAINIIVAATDDLIIGKNGTVPWHIKEDMVLFKDLTMNNTVIMGRKTMESIPQKFRPLPGRINVVVSRSLQKTDGFIVADTLEKAIVIANEKGKEIFCIGGRELYSSMMPKADFLHVSWVKKKYEGDVYFPKLNLEEWKEEERKEFDEFVYKKYSRIRG